MDLREFVNQTLCQIVEGVGDTQSRCKELGAVVNPHLNTSHEQAGKQGFLNASGSFSPVVQFDVALTVTEGGRTKGGTGVFAGAVTLGSSGQLQTESSSVSRVKVSVPVALPQ